MYRGKRTEPIEYEQGSDIDEAIMTEEPLNEAADYRVDESIGRHLSTDVFKQVQSIIVDIDVMASPDELARGFVPSEWKLLPHLSKKLKQNLALKNRDVAGDADHAGDLRRCIPLQFEILQQANTLPFFMGIRAPGMMDKTVYRQGACLWRVPPDTATMALPIGAGMAFEPTNVIDRHMYNNFRVCTPEDLAESITVVKGSKGKPGYGTISVGSVAYDDLIENLNAGAWRELDLTEEELDAIYEPPRHQHTVQVRQKMAEQLQVKLQQPLNDVIDRCVNLEDFTISVVRADGNPHFNSPQGLHGELVGSENDPLHKLSSTKLLTRGMFHIKAKFDYLLW